MYGRATDDSLSSSRVVGVAGIFHGHYSLSDSLEAELLAGARLETGSSSSLFTDEFEPNTRLFLREASLNWRMVPKVSLRAGAIHQHHHASPLLVDGGTFPAAMAAFDTSWDQIVLHLDAQGAIPVSRTLSTRATGKEPTPTLLTQKIIFGWEDKTTGLRATGRASHFAFDQLTRGMAKDSRYYGNDVVGVADASRFVYRFEGFELGPDFVVPLAKQWQWAAGASFLRNTQGPRSSNQGLYGYTDLTFKNNSFSLRPRFEWYRNEANSAPAFYSSEEFGHNNRKGVGASVRLALPSAEIELRARRGQLIEPRTFQRDRFDYLQLTVELPYAGF